MRCPCGKLNLHDAGSLEYGVIQQTVTKGVGTTELDVFQMVSNAFDRFAQRCGAVFMPDTLHFCDPGTLISVGLLFAAMWRINPILVE